MVIISTIYSITDVIVKATILLSQLPEKWYKGGSEIEKFKAKVSILSQNGIHWENQLRQYGISDHAVYNALLAQAVELLDAEKDYYDRQSKSRTWKLRRRSFPAQLTYILSSILDFVQAGPEFLAKRVERQELLTKRLLMDPLPLPFGCDPKYVPIQGMVNEVQRALENTRGQQVVTLYGAPGMGKSSLVKCVALKYQDSIRDSRACSFDGVHYLFCGQGCGERVTQLQKMLFSSLGCGSILEANQERQQGYCDLSFYQSALRRALGDRRMLIILDNVWREDLEALTSLISRGTSCRYLLTSQTKDAWPEACCIQMASPTAEEALDIFYNHIQEHPSSSRLQGSSTRTQTPSGAETLTEKIYQMMARLENHPLSMVNVAVSMNQYGLTDLDQWKFALESIFTFLDENYKVGQIFVYERPYWNSVSASMMLMVESLREKERTLLFLIALLDAIQERGIPQQLVEFFIRRLWDNPFQHTWGYFSAFNYLKDNSLIDVVGPERYSAVRGDSVQVIRARSFAIHNVRREYIRQKCLPDLKGIASSLLATHGDHHDGSLVNVRNNDQGLAIVLGVMHFDDALMEEVALPFQSLMTHMNGAGVSGPHQQQGGGPLAMRERVASHGPKQLIDARELAKNARLLFRDYFYSNAMDVVTRLLNVEGEELWKQQAYSDASKITMKLMCKGELHDESMSSLMTIPFTTAAAFESFYYIYRGIYRENWQHAFYYGHPQSPSDILPATRRALSNLLSSKNTPSANFGVFGISAIIEWMLEFESESTVLVELEKLRGVVNQLSDPPLKSAAHEGFLNLCDSRLTFEMLNGCGLREYLPTLLWNLIDDPEDQAWGFDKIMMYKRVILCVRRDKGFVKILLECPIPIEELLTNVSLFRRLLQVEERFGLEEPDELRRGPTSLLGVLSGTPEFQARAGEILRQDIWKEDFTLWPESFGVNLARFWGNLALLRDLHATTKLRVMKIAIDWIAKLREYNNGGLVCSSCRCSKTCTGEGCTCRPEKKSISSNKVAEVTRTVAIISHLLEGSRMLTSALQGSQEEWTKTTCMKCLGEKWRFYVRACQGQALAYQQMEMYGEAVFYLDLAQQACNSIPKESIRQETGYSSPLEDQPQFIETELRSHVILVRALSENYEGAMHSLDQYEQGLSPSLGRGSAHQFSIQANRAVLLRLSGEFSEAIHEFDKLLERWEHMTSRRMYWQNDPRLHNFLKCCSLDHRGYAKYLIGNLEESQLDRKSAEILRSSKLILEPISWEYILQSGWLMSNFTNLQYSLLQLPVN